MKHFALFLCLLWLVPVCGLCETILWEDEAGQVVLGDDGNVQFISPDGEAADENFFVPTAVPAEAPAEVVQGARGSSPDAQIRRFRRAGRAAPNPPVRTGLLHREGLRRLL